MTPKKSTRQLWAALGVSTAALLAGCVGTTTPELDSKFGESVRTVREKQTLNPGGTASKDVVQGIDGKAAVNAQDRYQDSFKAPPKTFEVLGIGGTLSGQ